MDKVENLFLEGQLDELRGCCCPKCAGPLYFAISPLISSGKQEPGRRFKCGITIWCRGDCDAMVSHLDGFCPEWAEGITDWDLFNKKLGR